MKLLSKHKLTLYGIAAGILGGYLYYYFIGCSSGSCAITSNPYMSMIYGAMMGGLLLSSFQKEENKQNN
jgi:hypothetical protein